jgi:hypothetical protein
VSGRALSAMTPAEVADLDPGIADTVLWLRRYGFDTCDSGDGKSKFQVPPDQVDTCAVPIANVAMMVDPPALASECDRLRALVEGAGGKVEQYDPEVAGPSIQGSYDAATGTALILLLGFALPSGLVP